MRLNGFFSSIFIAVDLFVYLVHISVANILISNDKVCIQVTNNSLANFSDCPKIFSLGFSHSRPISIAL